MGVLTERRARPAGRARRPRELDGNPELSHWAGGSWLVERQHHLARADELRLERLVEVEHRLEAAVVGGAELRPLVAAARGEDGLDLGVRGRAGAFELPLDDVLAPHPPAPRLPELGLERAERHPAAGVAPVRPVADVPRG